MEGECSEDFLKPTLNSTRDVLPVMRCWTAAQWGSMF